MDFDPRHEKWRCCCCRVPTAVTVLGTVECLVATAVFVLALHIINLHAETDKNGHFFLFDLCLASISLLFGLSSLLMLAGVRLRRERLLYPSVVMRVLLLIFVTVFGVSIGVVRPDNGDEGEDEDEPKRKPLQHQKGNKTVNQEEPSTALRLVFLIFLMILICLTVFYTIFLVLRTIRFIWASRRLHRRRSSFFVVGQIDPALMNIKRPSQCSY